MMMLAILSMYVTKIRTKATLVNHFRYQHEGIFHLCGECKYKSTTKSSIRKHTETKHEGVHYKCEKCDYKANRIQSLNKHIKSIHVSEEEVV